MQARSTHHVPMFSSPLRPSHALTRESLSGRRTTNDTGVRSLGVYPAPPPSPPASCSSQALCLHKTVSLQEQPHLDEALHPPLPCHLDDNSQCFPSKNGRGCLCSPHIPSFCSDRSSRSSSPALLLPAVDLCSCVHVSFRELRHQTYVFARQLRMLFACAKCVPKLLRVYFDHLDLGRPAKAGFRHHVTRPPTVNCTQCLSSDVPPATARQLTRQWTRWMG